MASQDVQVPNDETPMTTSGSSQSRSEGCQLKGGEAPGGTAPPLGREGGDSLAPLWRACRGTGLWARSPRRPAVTYGFFRGPWNPVLLRTPPHTPQHTPFLSTAGPSASGVSGWRHCSSPVFSREPSLHGDLGPAFLARKRVSLTCGALAFVITFSPLKSPASAPLWHKIEKT